MKIAYLGLGTNLGDREENLRVAAEMLASDRLRVKRASSIFETAPRDVLDQPFFLNQVLEVETDLFPRQLFTRAKQVERKMGRVRSQPKGPRLIDVDILLYGDSVVHVEGLEIPHAGIPARRFVLEPLAELAPEFRHPVTKRTIRQMLAEVSDQAVKRLGLRLAEQP
ncbi:MAG: 2-amino-4-hydroxy-6-hydroxymethyldihydropteridine diphosphokinase [Bryobacteraceae bacterium]